MLFLLWKMYTCNDPDVDIVLDMLIRQSERGLPLKFDIHYKCFCQEF